MSDLSKRVAKLEQSINEMDEFVMRIGYILSRHLPSTEHDMIDLIGKWNEIKRDINKEFDDVGEKQ